MPFVSQQQRKYMYSQKPNLAKEFEKETPKGKKLPKKVKKEEIEGALGDVYAVQKPYSGCEVGKLVHPFAPMNGIPMDQMQPDQIHAVFPDQDRAMAVANQLYQEHMAYEQALEEKKIKVTDKLKSAMTKLERLRSNSMKMIKENPKEAQPQREKVAHYTEKIDHLMTQLEMIEKSKKALDKKEKLKENINSNFEAIWGKTRSGDKTILVKDKKTGKTLSADDQDALSDKEKKEISMLKQKLNSASMSNPKADYSKLKAPIDSKAPDPNDEDYWE